MSLVDLFSIECGLLSNIVSTGQVTLVVIALLAVMGEILMSDQLRSDSIYEES